MAVFIYLMKKCKMVRVRVREVGRTQDKCRKP